MKKLPAVCPIVDPHPPSQYERDIIDAPKTARPRHPLAQAWRDAKTQPVYSMDKLTIVPAEIKLLTDGKVPMLLLTAGEEYEALTAIRNVDGYPVVLFMKTFGVPVMESLLSKGQIRTAKDKLFFSGIIGDTTEPCTPDMQEMVTKVAAADVETRQTAAAYTEARAEFAELLTLDTPAPVEAPKRVFPVAPIFKGLPSNQNLNPLGNAVVDRQMKLNTKSAFSLAGQITDDANAAHRWLRDCYGITPGSMITTDKLAEIQKAVAGEQLKYANKQVLAAINAWGMEIFGGNHWAIRMAGDTIQYSGKRTKLMRHLYQAEADLWLRDLRLKASPEQTIAAGRRLDVIMKGAFDFGKRVH